MNAFQNNFASLIDEEGVKALFLCDLPGSSHALRGGCAASYRQV